MRLNLKYLKSILGILKLVSIVLGILAFSTGLNAFMNSEYNKGCRDGSIPVKQTTVIPPTTLDSNGTSTSTASTPRNSILAEIMGIGSDTLIKEIKQATTDSSTTGTSSDEPVTELIDRAPILWMERFLLISIGICNIFTMTYIIVFLLKDGLEDNKIARGIEFGFHFIGTIWLLIGSVFMAYSASKIESLSEELCSKDIVKCQLFAEKLSSAALSVLMAVTYFTICIKGFGKKFYQTV